MFSSLESFIMFLLLLSSSLVSYVKTSATEIDLVKVNEMSESCSLRLGIGLHEVLEFVDEVAG